MPYMIGQCCTDQIIIPPPGSGGGSGLNEPIPFTNVSSLIIPWNATRKARFGDAAVIYIEILGTDGVYRWAAGIEAIPNNITNTSFYTIDFGGLTTGRATIT